MSRTNLYKVKSISTILLVTIRQHSVFIEFHIEIFTAFWSRDRLMNAHPWSMSRELVLLHFLFSHQKFLYVINLRYWKHIGIRQRFNSLRPSDAYMRHSSDAYMRHHWFRWRLVAWPAPSHYLNQSWNIINWIHRNFSEILSEIRAFHSRKCIWKCRLRNGVYLSRPQCVKTSGLGDDILHGERSRIGGGQ